MEFNEKLQELRKRKGLTQEEVAEALFVSRTAVSKWELGKGYPNIESLKAIAGFFCVTVDELLSGDELLEIVEEDTKERKKNFRDLIFGLLDCVVAVFYFLPLFGQMSDGGVRAVSLISLTGIASYLYVLYFAIVIGMNITGILLLALQNTRKKFLLSVKMPLSLIANVLGVILFTATLQPYAAVFLLVFLIIKAFVLIKLQ